MDRDNAKTSEFDYVVVGGGSAGCVVAARLAAETQATVALIERGRSDDNRWIHIPATFFKALQSQDAETIMSEPDPSLDGLEFPVPQGKVLGGGSSVNGMLYMRGQARDYDDWESEHGCSGWGYAEVLKTFRSQECNTRISDDYHGSTGPLVVSDPSAPHPVSAKILEAAQSAGIPGTRDFNGAKQEGAGWYQVTADNGKRQSAAVCFLRPVIGAENLTLFTDHNVERIRIENRRAVGVEMRATNGDEVFLTARKEVILCAGSFQSPKLLMLSGVGPAEELRRHGIDVVQDAPQVGQNYQDHVGTPVTRRLKDPIGLYGQDRGLKAIRNGIDYWVFNRGLLTSNLLDAGACVDTDGDGRPDVQYNFAPFAPSAPGKPPLDFQALQVHPMTMRPKSRGRLGLRSKDAQEALKFDTAMLSHEDDLDTLRRGVRLAREIFEQPALKDMVAEEIWPGKDIYSGSGSNSLDGAIRKHARTIFHPAGTCRMGPTDADVVDLELRVYGVENLRIADCSIMPALVSGNTNAPTMMIAGRAVDAIIATHHPTR